MLVLLVADDTTASQDAIGYCRGAVMNHTMQDENYGDNKYILTSTLQGTFKK